MATGDRLQQEPAASGTRQPELGAKTKQILASATEQARQLGHREIRPDHLLLALLLEKDNGVTRPLRWLLVGPSGQRTLSGLRERLVERLQSIETARLPGAAEPAALADGCKLVLRIALGEASRLDSPEVSPAHLFYGLVREGSALDGTDVVTLLALRGLRNAIGSREWRSSGQGIVPRLPVSLAEHKGPVVAAYAGVTSAATRDNVITFRVTDAELAAVDMLVESGAMRTRSEASAWLLQSGIAANQDFFEQIRGMSEEIARLRGEVQRLVEARIGPSVPTEPQPTT
jgi:hypothetical protein